MITHPDFTSHKGKYHFRKERKRDTLKNILVGLLPRFYVLF